MHFLAYLEHLIIIAVLVVMGWFSWCTLRDRQQARAYAARKAKALPDPVGLVFGAVVFHDRLTDPTEAENAILEARRKARERLDRAGRTKWPTHDDYDIDAITRQIEEQN